MPQYDLNVPYPTSQSDLHTRISFLSELGYTHLALNHTLEATAKNLKPHTLKNPISPPTATFPKLKFLTRCTVLLTQPSTPRLAPLRPLYDLLALRPSTEKLIAQATQSTDFDILSLDLAIRYPFHFRPKTFSPLLAAGIAIELCYSPGVLSPDSERRRRVWQNAAEIVRATRGRGIILSGEASAALGLRGPADVVNLAVLWGMAPDRAVEGVGEECRKTVARGQMRKKSWRGAVVVGGLQKGEMQEAEQSEQGKKNGKGKKRKGIENETDNVEEAKKRKGNDGENEQDKVAEKKADDTPEGDTSAMDVEPAQS